MEALRIFLKKLLGEIDKMIDKGECDDFSQEDLELLSALLHPPTTMGRDAAAKFLGLSLNKFHEYRDLRLIPAPRPRKGFKEKEYYTSDLRKAKGNIELYLQKNSLVSRPKSV